VQVGQTVEAHRTMDGNRAGGKLVLFDEVGESDVILAEVLL